MLVDGKQPQFVFDPPRDLSGRELLEVAFAALVAAAWGGTRAYLDLRRALADGVGIARVDADEAEGIVRERFGYVVNMLLEGHPLRAPLEAYRDEVAIPAMRAEATPAPTAPTGGPSLRAV